MTTPNSEFASPWSIDFRSLSPTVSENSAYRNQREGGSDTRGYPDGETTAVQPKHSPAFICRAQRMSFDRGPGGR